MRMRSPVESRGTRRGFGALMSMGRDYLHRQVHRGRIAVDAATTRVDPTDVSADGWDGKMQS